MKYAITLASFRDIEPVGRTLGRISALGYDTVEMYGEPEVDVRELQELFSSHGMAVCGVTGMWGAASGEGWKRRLASSDAGVRKHAKDYVEKCVEMCRSLGGSRLNVCLFADDGLSVFDKTHRAVPADRKAAAQDLAVPALSELAGFAADRGVTLVLEPLNRYSTPYCSSAQDALGVAGRVAHENFRIMLDTFHMNIEEDSFEHTISKANGMLAHMHFADNNRKMPGYGHIDFKSIMGALSHIGYGGYATFEPTIQDAGYEEPLKNGLQFVKSLHAKA
jgi:D-psicose/D-tagatose/L-ribulose 3-epimerase